MRRFVALGIVGIALIVMVSVSGCVQTPTTRNQTNQTQVTQLGNVTGNATSNATQAPAQIGQINITATSTQAPSQVGIFVPRQGSQYVFYNVTLDNVNATDRPASPLFFTAHDAANNTYSTDPATFDPSIHGFPAATLTRPGDVVNGIVVFQVPQNATVTTLTYNDHFSEETISL